jgi:hypothetical protein
MERLNKEGLAYYHSLIKGMLEVAGSVETISKIQIDSLFIGDDEIYVYGNVTFEKGGSNEIDI